MTYQTRRLLLYISITVFAVATGPIVFYTLGYRIALHDLTLRSTGGLFIVSRPASATVYVNNSRKETSLIAGSIFVQNLTPGPYEIRVEKPGHHSWTKKLHIKPYSVTEARITLIPLEPVRATIATSTFTDMRGSPNARAFLLLKQHEKSKNSLAVFDTNTQKTLAYDDERSRIIAERISVMPTNINWSKNERAALGKTSDDWIEITLTDQGTVRIQSLWRQSGLAAETPRIPRLIASHPENADQFYVLDSTNLSIWNREKLTFQPLLTTISAFAVRENTLLLHDTQSGLLLETDLGGGSPRAVSQENIPAITSGTIYTQPTGHVVRADTELWFVPADTQKPLRLGAGIPDGNITVRRDTILWHDNHNINTFWIGPEKGLPYFQEVRSASLPSFKQPITSMFPYPLQSYLVVHAGSTVTVIELDGRGGVFNSAPLYTGSADLKLFVPETERAAYVLDAGALVRITLP